MNNTKQFKNPPPNKDQFDDVLKRMFSMPPAPKKAPPKPAQQPKK